MNSEQKKTKNYSLVYIFGSIPAIYEAWKTTETREDGSELLHEKCNFIVVNPSLSNQLDCVPYCFTLLPVRNDLIIGTADVKECNFLTDNSDEEVKKVPQKLRLDESVQKIAKRFFSIEKGGLSVTMANWLNDPDVMERWDHFMSEEINGVENVSGFHPIAEILKSL